MGMYGGGAPGALKRHSRHPAQAVGNEGVGLLFDPFGNVSIRRPAMGRIVFEAAESRRVMRRSDDDAVRETALATAIVGENRVRDDRGRSVTIVSIDHHVDAICCEHLQSAGKSGLRKRVRIDADVERSVNALLLAIKANRLRDGEDVGLVEARYRARSRDGRKFQTRRVGRARMDPVAPCNTRSPAGAR